MATGDGRMHLVDRPLPERTCAQCGDPPALPSGQPGRFTCACGILALLRL